MYPNVQRTHGWAITALYVWHREKMFTVIDCHTKAQCADIFTKHFNSKEDLEHGLELVGIVGPDRVKAL